MNKLQMYKCKERFNVLQRIVIRTVNNTEYGTRT